MSFETYFIFFFTTMVVVFTPGAAALAVAAQGASNGLRRALFGVVGVASANVVYFVFSATGIASILIASNVVFAFIKWIGVAYLLYLGFTILLSKQGAIRVTSDKGSSRGRGLFARGFIVEAANPKALLYFAAILPQFVDISQPVLAQFLLMGVTTVVLDLVSYSTYAALGSRLVRGGSQGLGDLAREQNRRGGAAICRYQDGQRGSRQIRLIKRVFALTPLIKPL